MRYAIFTDIHANLEALEAVLAKIDEIAEKEPIDQIWFLGDLVGYGPDPNECILKLRERTDVIIAGNHDWAAVGRIDLEDFSAAARVSAEWTAEQLTAEHRDFLTNLPERLEIGECTLVHGSPFGPLWEYLTSEVLAERSFQYFSSRYCLVGHTHVPVIFIQPDTIANVPTLPLTDTGEHDMLSQANGSEHSINNGNASEEAAGEDEPVEMVVIHPPAQQSALSVQARAENAPSAYKDPNSGQAVTESEANVIIERKLDSIQPAGDQREDQHVEEAPIEGAAEVDEVDEVDETDETNDDETSPVVSSTEHEPTTEDEHMPSIETTPSAQEKKVSAADAPAEEPLIFFDNGDATGETTPEHQIAEAEERLNSEIEELLTLLGLSESMIQVTNEMLAPPEGNWEAPPDYRAIINPGGVGQPRDGDPRAAFMIYDTERGFEFYRVPYDFEKTQEKIIKTGLPHYLAVRLAYGR